MEVNGGKIPLRNSLPSDNGSEWISLGKSKKKDGITNAKIKYIDLKSDAVSAADIHDNGSSVRRGQIHINTESSGHASGSEPAGVNRNHGNAPGPQPGSAQSGKINNSDRNTNPSAAAGENSAAAINSLAAGSVGMVGAALVRGVNLCDPVNFAITTAQHAPSLIAAVADDHSRLATGARHCAKAMTVVGVAASVSAAASVANPMVASAILGSTVTRLYGQHLIFQVVGWGCEQVVPDRIRKLFTPWAYATAEIAMALILPSHIKDSDGTNHFSWMGQKTSDDGIRLFKKDNLHCVANNVEEMCLSPETKFSITTTRPEATTTDQKTALVSGHALSEVAGLQQLPPTMESTPELSHNNQQSARDRLPSDSVLANGVDEEEVFYDASDEFYHNIGEAVKDRSPRSANSDISSSGDAPGVVQQLGQAVTYGLETIDTLLKFPSAGASPVTPDYNLSTELPSNIDENDGFAKPVKNISTGYCTDEFRAASDGSIVGELNLTAETYTGTVLYDVKLFPGNEKVACALCSPDLLKQAATLLGQANWYFKWGRTPLTQEQDWPKARRMGIKTGTYALSGNRGRYNIEMPENKGQLILSRADGRVNAEDNWGVVASLDNNLRQLHFVAYKGLNPPLGQSFVNERTCPAALLGESSGYCTSEFRAASDGSIIGELNLTAETYTGTVLYDVKLFPGNETVACALCSPDLLKQAATLLGQANWYFNWGRTPLTQEQDWPKARRMGIKTGTYALSGNRGRYNIEMPENKGQLILSRADGRVNAEDNWGVVASLDNNLRQLRFVAYKGLNPPLGQSFVNERTCPAALLGESSGYCTSEFRAASDGSIIGELNLTAETYTGTVLYDVKLFPGNETVACALCSPDLLKQAATLLGQANWYFNWGRTPLTQEQDWPKARRMGIKTGTYPLSGNRGRYNIEMPENKGQLILSRADGRVNAEDNWGVVASLDNNLRQLRFVAYKGLNPPLGQSFVNERTCPAALLGESSGYCTDQFVAASDGSIVGELTLTAETYNGRIDPTFLYDVKLFPGNEKVACALCSPDLLKQAATLLDQADWHFNWGRTPLTQEQDWPQARRMGIKTGKYTRAGYDGRYNIEMPENKGQLILSRADGRVNAEDNWGVVASLDNNLRQLRFVAYKGLNPPLGQSFVNERTCPAALLGESSGYCTDQFVAASDGSIVGELTLTAETYNGRIDPTFLYDVKLFPGNEKVACALCSPDLLKQAATLLDQADWYFNWGRTPLTQEQDWPQARRMGIKTGKYTRAGYGGRYNIEMPENKGQLILSRADGRVNAEDNWGVVASLDNNLRQLRFVAYRGLNPHLNTTDSVLNTTCRDFSKLVANPDGWNKGETTIQLGETGNSTATLHGLMLAHNNSRRQLLCDPSVHQYAGQLLSHCAEVSNSECEPVIAKIPELASGELQPLISSDLINVQVKNGTHAFPNRILQKSQLLLSLHGVDSPNNSSAVFVDIDNKINFTLYPEGTCSAYRPKTDQANSGLRSASDSDPADARHLLPANAYDQAGGWVAIEPTLNTDLYGQVKFTVDVKSTSSTMSYFLSKQQDLANLLLAYRSPLQRGIEGYKSELGLPITSTQTYTDKALFDNKCNVAKNQLRVWQYPNLIRSSNGEITGTTGEINPAILLTVDVADNDCAKTLELSVYLPDNVPESQDMNHIVSCDDGLDYDRGGWCAGQPTAYNRFLGPLQFDANMRTRNETSGDILLDKPVKEVMSSLLFAHNSAGLQGCQGIAEEYNRHFQDQPGFIEAVIDELITDSTDWVKKDTVTTQSGLKDQLRLWKFSRDSVSDDVNPQVMGTINKNTTGEQYLKINVFSPDYVPQAAEYLKQPESYDILSTGYEWGDNCYKSEVVVSLDKGRSEIFQARMCPANDGEKAILSSNSLMRTAADLMLACDNQQSMSCQKAIRRTESVDYFNQLTSDSTLVRNSTKTAPAMASNRLILSKSDDILMGDNNPAVLVDLDNESVSFNVYQRGFQGPCAPVSGNEETLADIYLYCVDHCDDATSCVPKACDKFHYISKLFMNHGDSWDVETSPYHSHASLEVVKDQSMKRLATWTVNPEKLSLLKGAAHTLLDQLATKNQLRAEGSIITGDVPAARVLTEQGYELAFSNLGFTTTNTCGGFKLHRTAGIREDLPFFALSNAQKGEIKLFFYDDFLETNTVKVCLTQARKTRTFPVETISFNTKAFHNGVKWTPHSEKDYPEVCALIQKPGRSHWGEVVFNLLYDIRLKSHTYAEMTVSFEPVDKFDMYYSFSATAQSAGFHEFDANALWFPDGNESDEELSEKFDQFLVGMKALGHRFKDTKQKARIALEENRPLEDIGTSKNELMAAEGFFSAMGNTASAFGFSTAGSAASAFGEFLGFLGDVNDDESIEPLLNLGGTMEMDHAIPTWYTSLGRGTGTGSRTYLPSEVRARMPGSKKGKERSQRDPLKSYATSQAGAVGYGGTPKAHLRSYDVRGSNEVIVEGKLETNIRQRTYVGWECNEFRRDSDNCKKEKEETRNIFLPHFWKEHRCRNVNIRVNVRLYGMRLSANPSLSQYGRVSHLVHISIKYGKYRPAFLEFSGRQANWLEYCKRYVQTKGCRASTICPIGAQSATGCRFEMCTYHFETKAYSLREDPFCAPMISEMEYFYVHNFDSKYREITGRGEYDQPEAVVESPPNTLRLAFNRVQWNPLSLADFGPNSFQITRGPSKYRESPLHPGTIIMAPMSIEDANRFSFSLAKDLPRCVEKCTAVDLRNSLEIYHRIDTIITRKDGTSYVASSTRDAPVELINLD